MENEDEFRVAGDFSETVKKMQKYLNPKWWQFRKKRRLKRMRRSLEPTDILVLSTEDKEKGREIQKRIDEILSKGTIEK